MLFENRAFVKEGTYLVMELVVVLHLLEIFVVLQPYFLSAKYWYCIIFYLNSVCCNLGCYLVYGTNSLWPLIFFYCTVLILWLKYSNHILIQMNGGTFLLELVGMKIHRTMLFGIVPLRPLNFDFGPPTGDKHWPELVDDSFFPPVLSLSLQYSFV